MSDSGGSSDGFLDNNIGGFAYGVGVSIGILLLVTTITLASYFCSTRNQNPQPPSTRSRRRSRLTAHGDSSRIEPPDDDLHYVIDVGLEEEVIKSYPTLLYSEVAKGRRKDSDASCCAICLADYRNPDKLMMLPECNHLFHHKCIDPWLRLHPTCPLCRTSPLPTPLSTPLAEVVPLASRRD